MCFYHIFALSISWLVLNGVVKVELRDKSYGDIAIQMGGLFFGPSAMERRYGGCTNAPFLLAI